MPCKLSTIINMINWYFFLNINRSFKRNNNDKKNAPFVRFINLSLLTLLFTRNEKMVDALSNWSVHTTWRRPWWMKWPVTKMKKIKEMIPCKSHPNCPFLGQMPELLKIDI